MHSVSGRERRDWIEHPPGNLRANVTAASPPGKKTQQTTKLIAASAGAIGARILPLFFGKSRSSLQVSVRSRLRRCKSRLG